VKVFAMPVQLHHQDPDATIRVLTVMARRLQKALTLSAVLGFVWWLFGNLYEAIVISPNWVVDSPAQLARLNAFFVHTTPTAYFIPVVPLATLLAWALWGSNREVALKGDYRRAAALAAAAMAVNAFIVSTLIVRLFGDDFLAHAAELHAYAWRWNLLNVVRMALVAATAWQLFRAFVKLARA
jgi:hypothetical protein